MESVKVVLDADVLIHFSKAGMLSFLPEILPEYDHVILSAVYEETSSIRAQIDNQVKFMRNLSVLPFQPSGEMRREYAKLRTSYGKGESACMAYCRYTNNVIGSSNLKDIRKYCTERQITYLTTLDFLYYAFSRGKLTEEECARFIADVNTKGSKLPKTDITKYTPNAIL